MFNVHSLRKKLRGVFCLQRSSGILNAKKQKRKEEQKCRTKQKETSKKMIIAAGVMVSVIISSVTANADTKSPARTDSDFVVVAEADGNVDQTAVDRANELLNRLPVQVLKNFQNRGWRFLVTDKNIARTYYSGQYSSVQGMTDYDEKFVMVEQRSKAVEEATLHEFGHYLDWYYNITQRIDSAGNLGVPIAEYADIYNAETGAFTNTFDVYFHYEPIEFFAEGVYRVYSEYYDDVAESCQRLTKSVEDMVNADASYDVSYSDNYQAEYVQNYETNYSTDYSYDFSDGF